MAFTVKGITIKIGADTSKLQEALNEVAKDYKGLDQLTSRLKKSMVYDKKDIGGIQSFTTYQKLLGLSIEKTGKQFSVVSTTISQYRKKLVDLENEYRNGSISEEEYNKKQKELTDNLVTLETKALTLSNELKKLNSEFVSGSDSVNRFYYATQQVGNSLVQISQKSRLMSAGLFMVLSQSVKTTIDFESAWAGVLKTVEGSEEQLAKVNQGLKDLPLNTMSTYEDIAGYAEIAGQLGIATNDIVEFTKTITMLNDTTNLYGEEGAKAIARIKNIFQGTNQVAQDYYSRMGSAIVDLGNNFATTESEITDMSLVMAAAGKQAGMAETDVLALSTALTSMGVKANAGGSSMSKMLQSISLAVANGTDNLKDYAEVAGMSAEQFSKAWKDDAGKTFLQFVEGIQGQSDDASVALQKLSELGLTEEVRLTRAMSALAGSSDLYAEALRTSNNAWSENIAMTNEAEKRYQTLEAQLNQAKEALKQAGESIGKVIAPFIKDLSERIRDGAKAFSELDESTVKTVANILTAGMLFSTTTGAIGKTVLGVGSLIKAYGQLSNKIKIINDVSKGIAGPPTAEVAELTSSISKLSVQTLSFVKTGGLLVAGFASIALATYAVYKAYQNQLKAQKEKMAADDAEMDAMFKLTEAQKERSKAIQDSIDRGDKYISNLTDNTKIAEKYVDLMSELNKQDSINAGEKAQLQTYVERLNEMYPGLNFSIDENTGHVLLNGEQWDNNTESIKKNIEELQKQSKIEAYQNSIRSYAEALGEATVAYEEQTYAMGVNREKTKELWKQKLELLDSYSKEKISLDEYAKQAKVIDQQLSVLDTAYKENSKAVEENANKMVESSQKMYESMQMMSEDGALVDDLRVRFESLAETLGDNLPKSIADGLKDGASKLEIQQAIEDLARIEAYQSIFDDARLSGELIPQNIQNGILSNLDSVESAIETVNTLSNFQVMVEAAGLSGAELTSEMAEQIINGSVKAENAVDQLEKGVVDSFYTDDEWEKMGREVGEGYAKGIKDNEGEAESASKSLSDAAKRGANTDLSAEGSYAGQSFVSGILGAINGSSSYISSTVKNILASVGGGTPSLAQMQSSNGMVFGATPNFLSDYNYPSVGATQDVISSNNTIRSIKSRENVSIGVSEVIRKLDDFIDTFKNVNFVTKTQVVTPNGDALTDIVEDTMAIRDYLDSYGRGV